MTRTILIPTRVSGPWARALAILLIGGAFATAASFIGPAPSSATMTPLRRSNADANSESFADAVKLPAYLGSLTSRGYQVEVYVGRTGPIYTVSDLSGNVLAKDLNADALYARFPELDLNGLHAEGEPKREPAAD